MPAPIQNSRTGHAASSRFWLLALALVLCLLLTSAPIHGQGDDPRYPVTLQLKWRHQFQFAGYYAAAEQGFYRDAGLDVTIVEAREGVDPIQAVVDGQAQFGVGNSELVLWRGRGVPVVVLGAIFQHSPLAFLTTERADITTVHDLAGKRVALEPNSAELLAYLSDEGLSADDIEFLPHDFDTEALLSGTIDAMSAYSTDEPFALQNAGTAYRLFSPRSAGIDFYGDVLFTTEAVIAEHPDIVRAFLSASLDGWRYAFEHTDELADHIYDNLSQRHSREHLAFEAEQMRRLVLPDLVEPGSMFAGRWRHIVDTYDRVGLLEGPVVVEGLLYAPERQQNLTRVQRLLVGMGLVVLIVGLLALRIYRLYRQLQRQSVERERAQQLLAESENRYRTLIERAPLPVIITRLTDGEFRYLNPRAERELKFATAAWTGKPATGVYHNPDDRNRLLDRLLSQGQIDGEEVALRRTDGSVFWASVSSTLIAFEEEQAIFATFVDLTERREMETHLRDSEALYRSILHASPDSIAIIDLEGHFIMVSPSWAAMFGFDHESDLTGLQVLDFVAASDRARVARDMEEIIDLKEGGRAEVQVLRRDGHEFTIEVTSEIILDHEAKPHQILLMLRDITERKQAEAQAFELAVEQERVKLLSGFIQNASHEFRTPLSVISSSAYLVTRAEGDERRRQHADNIVQQVMHINRLVDMLMQVAVLDSGAPLQPGPVELSEIIQESIDSVRSEAGHLTMTVDAPPLPTQPLLDANKIRIALTHLLENAVRYTAPGGSIETRLFEREGQIVVEVRDTGMGIEADVLPRVFDHFWRHDKAHSTPGFGLGLSLVRKIVEAHGGQVEVESIVNSGSTFRVLLPLTGNDVRARGTLHSV